MSSSFTPTWILLVKNWYNSSDETNLELLYPPKTINLAGESSIKAKHQCILIVEMIDFMKSLLWNENLIFRFKREKNKKHI